MKRKVKAKISWVPSEEGGRSTPPVGSRLVSVSRFEKIKDSYRNEAWSLVLDFTDVPSDSADLIADVSFLVDDAPHHLLHAGSKFDLFEGPRLVAKGEVI